MKETMMIQRGTLKVILLKKIYDFNNGMELSRKITSDQMKLEEIKKTAEYI